MLATIKTSDKYKISFNKKRTQNTMNINKEY